MLIVATMTSACACIMRDIVNETVVSRDLKPVLMIAIALSREGATDGQVIAAAKAANAHDLIMALPGGYDCYTGENGGNLAGGQKQRIAIARAMLRDAEIPILDEATSALDSCSEAQIRYALARLTKGCATITIAHRHRPSRRPTNVVVMENSTVVERGELGSLLSQDGRFKRLFELQLLLGRKSLKTRRNKVAVLASRDGAAR